jgi:hypothetical protein
MTSQFAGLYKRRRAFDARPAQITRWHTSGRKIVMAERNLHWQVMNNEDSSYSYTNGTMPCLSSKPHYRSMKHFVRQQQNCRQHWRTNASTRVQQKRGHHHLVTIKPTTSTTSTLTEQDITTCSRLRLCLHYIEPDAVAWSNTSTSYRSRRCSLIKYVFAISIQTL